MLLNIMKIFKNLFGNSSKISASEIALDDGRLVSNSVIMESDGNYVKWADGTMVCWRNITNTSGTYGNSWTFPQTFVANPTVSANAFVTNIGAADAYNPVINIASLSSTTVYAHVFDTKTGKAYSSVTVMYMAFGRWK